MDRHELLRAYQPLDADGAMQQRVRLAIARRTVSRRAPVAVRWLRPAIALLAVLVLSSFAAAWIVRLRRQHAIVVAPASPVAAQPSRAPAVASPKEIPAPVPPPAIAAPIRRRPGASTSLPRPIAQPEPVQAPVVEEAPATPSPSAPRGPTAEESRLLMEGLSALRVAHDNEKAEHAFARYLDTFPDGALVEDALAYEIESTAARESVEAGRLADEYLRRFPHGRFRIAAERAKKKFAD